MKVAWWQVAVACGVLAIVGVLVFFALRGDSPSVAAASASPTPHATGPSASDAPLDRLADLESGLVSQDPAEIEQWLAPDVAEAWQSEGGTPLLAAGSTMSIDAATWTESDGFASVDATISGPEPMVSTLFLVDVDGRWLLAGTEEN
ncbi:hypothetical protein QQX13_02425 [Demequina sp. SYSU T00068]|uniref:hypothetical protein n=1 Tax=Demequina lignilytica TaxID=3051663 RepID=UPI0026223EBD|nr:hypothetical protein [Demequina sp. SYSU T00068]MDN4489680.1 hypothetical protein [Demequina sp. SYSU T00068]